MLGVIGILGVILRVVLTYHVQGQLTIGGHRLPWVGGDGFQYSIQANANASGHWFETVYGQHVPDAFHPPLWVMFLTGLAWLGGHSWLAQKLLGAVLGAVTVVIVGLAGRSIGGRRVALIAAGIAAVYPAFWMYGLGILSESLLFSEIGLLVLVSYRYIRRPTALGSLGVGALTGLLALTRAEQLLLLALLVLPLTLSRRSLPFARRLSHLALAVLAVIALLLPWTIYNEGRFQKTVVLSNGLGNAMVQSTCESGFYGPLIGAAAYDCQPKLPPHVTDQSVQNSLERKQALTFAKRHWTRLPLVVVAREGRTFGLWNPLQQTRLDQRFDLLPIWVHRATLISYWVLLFPAVLGAFFLRRMRVPLYPLLAFVGTVALTTAVTFGSTRYRAPAEVTLVLLAAAGIEALLGLLGTRGPRWSRDRAVGEATRDLPGGTPAAASRT